MPYEKTQISRKSGKQNRPKETPWHQQRMAAVRPHYTIRTAGPMLVALGAVMFSLGIAMYFAVENSLELEIEYTQCKALNGTYAHNLLSLNSNNSSINATTPIQCEFKFELNEKWGADGKEVRFYYKLSGFYQNFRLYLSSRDDLQLSGKLERQNISDCEPYQQYGQNSTYPIIPCGLIANSLFNDTFAMYHHTGNTTVRIPFTARDLLGKLEIERKFKNPIPYSANQTQLCEAFAKFNATRPKSWQKEICELGWNPDDEEMLEGLSDEQKEEERMAVGQGLRFIDFMIWMKPAALPSFRKTYRKLNTLVPQYKDGLKDGTYTVVVNYNYPVVDYKIKKFFVLTAESWMGPRNHFLPIIYMVTGSFCLLLGGVFLVGCICKRILIRPVDNEPPAIRM